MQGSNQDPDQGEEELLSADLEVVYTSINSTPGAIYQPSQSSKGILEIYSSLVGQDRVVFIETLNARERQALYNMLKESLGELQEWERLFQPPLEDTTVTQTSTHRHETSPLQNFTVTAEKETLNKSIYHLREIIHSRDPAPLRAKAEEYFTSIESQFTRLLAAMEVRQANTTIHQDKSKQTASLQPDPVLPDSVLGQNKDKTSSLCRHASCGIPSSQRPQHDSPSTILLYPLINLQEEGTDLPGLLSSGLPKSSAKIVNIKNIKSEGMAISLASNEDSEIFRAEIANSETLKSKISFKTTKKRHPSVIIYNVHVNVPEMEIQEILRDQKLIETELKLRFKFKGKSPEHQNWVFATPAQEFSSLMKINKIPIRYEMHRLGEFFHYKLCNYCQSFGHTTKNCTFSTPSCGHCAGHHMTRDCNHEYITCVNCFISNQNFQTTLSTWHHTKHPSCPCLQKEIKRYISTRDYVSSVFG
ncbi:hypothetical protein AVEN_43074-1 [Araneus ventricosus]|uniref:CCHC-type domain-containing protein n=1 Tax=Araneus ventricosus TaxID=182803 RepID=A0A4Y2M7D0_ARAVE|nr:hypothetical protein AVEN_43074-1 [Araneus ventricosus]